jgi:hypothetical protein
MKTLGIFDLARQQYERQQQLEKEPDMVLMLVTVCSKVTACLGASGLPRRHCACSRASRGANSG